MNVQTDGISMWKPIAIVQAQHFIHALENEFNLFILCINNQIN